MISGKVWRRLPLRTMLQMDLEGEAIALLAERALWWEKEKTLIVADIHWGKSAHFRKHGIAIPLQTQTNDEMRLANLLRGKKAERLVIAGDLFHSKTNMQVDFFSHFRNHHQSLHIDLVIGNHDILNEEQYNSFDLAHHKDCFTMLPFCIAHDKIDSEHFVIHGHIHPALRIKSKGYNQPTLKLCCFAQDDERMILPAFGQFTGTCVLDETNYKHLYLVAESEVIQWK